MMVRVFRMVVVGLFAVMVLQGCASSAAHLTRFEFTRVVMGVKARVIVYSASEADGAAHARAAFERLNEIDAALSDYRQDSELARFLKGLPGEPQTLSPDFFGALRRSEEVRILSGGAFHAGVGASVKLWREARRTGILPSPDEIARARPVEHDPGFTLGPGNTHAALSRSGVLLDFGGIGKGYAAQAAVDLLRGRGASRCLVALAGDIVAGEAPPGQPGWDIAISRSSNEPPVASIRLANLAVSTSGDAEQYVEIGGTHYAHIIDPRSGQALTTAACATVLASRGEDADAWASALCVLAARGEPAPTLVGDPLMDAAWIIDIGGERPSRTVQNDAMWRRVRLKWADAEAGRHP